MIWLRIVCHHAQPVSAEVLLFDAGSAKGLCLGVSLESRQNSVQNAVILVLDKSCFGWVVLTIRLTCVLLAGVAKGLRFLPACQTRSHRVIVVLETPCFG